MEKIYSSLRTFDRNSFRECNFRDVGHSSIARAHNVGLPDIIFHIRDYLIPAAWNCHAEIRE